MDEWQNNLLFQSLSKENDNYVMQFEKTGKLIYGILKVLPLKENEFFEAAKVDEENLSKILDETILISSEDEFETSTPIKKRPPLPPSLTTLLNCLTKMIQHI